MIEPRASEWQVGLAYKYAQSASSGGTVLSSAAYTWAQDGANNPYIGTTATTLDPASANVTTSTVQTLDSYGNVLTQQVYDYGNPTTPLRSYTNTWLHTSNSNYANAYIRNRLLTSTVTDNQSNTVTLVSNTYDTGSLAAVSPTPTEFDTTVGSGTNTVRGNVTQTVSPGSTVSYAYNVTGQMVTGANAMSGTGASLTYSSATNFAAPDTAAPLAGTGDVQGGHTVTQASSSALQGSFSYNNALALVSSVMPNAATTSQTISPSTGLLTSSVSVYGATTNYTYAYSPTVITATTNGHWTTSYKDGFGRDLAVEAGYGSTIISVTQTQYGPCACSPLGKATYISLPYASTLHYGIQGAVATASDGTHNIGWNSYVYDGLGRTVTQMAADASPTSYVYLGNTVKVTDPAGNWKRYTSDTLGNLVKVEEPNPAYGQADNTGTNFVTNYAYDVEGHLVSVSMPRPNGSGSYTQTRTFSYNPVTGKLMSATNPENGTVSYGYYPDGVLKSKTDAKGQVVQYSYDGYGRLAYIDRYPDGVTLDYCQSVALAYDSSQTGANVAGRLAQAITGDIINCPRNPGTQIQENYSYTAGGLTTYKGYTVTVNGNLGGFTGYQTYNVPFGENYSYDTEGHMTGYGPYTYMLDAMGRPVGLTQSNGTVWVQNVAYGPKGEMQTMQYKQGGAGTLYFTETRTYNSRAQLKELKNGLSTKNELDLQYVYNPGANNGQVAQMNDVVSGEQTVYAYDSLRRLIQAQASVTNWGQSFGYDGWGNLVSKTPTAGHTGTSMSLTVDATMNHVTTTGFGYDLNGNVTSLPNVTSMPSGYDVENRMGGTWYDQQNQPLDRGGVWNLYGLHGERLATYTYSAGVEYNVFNNVPYPYWNVTTTQVSQNIYFAGRMIQSNGTGVATDRLGSVRVDDSGNTTEYYPYGEVEKGTATSGDLFATYARDSSTKLDYANQRWYTSTYGRFTSPDRFKGSRWTSHPQTWNAYMYVMGDPINHRDRSGREQECGDDDSSPCGFDCTALPVDSFYDPSCQMEPSGGDSGEGPVDNSHPDQPTCSISVYNRPIEAFHGLNLPGAQHGFIEFTAADGTVDFAEGQKNGSLVGAYAGDTGGQLAGDTKVVNGVVVPNGNLDGQETGSQVCGWLSTLESDASAVNQQSIGYHWWGPNSSSVLSYMLNSLPDTSWFSLPWMIGYGSKLPGINKP
jgi:RHS repeat-associated protein